MSEDYAVSIDLALLPLPLRNKYIAAIKKFDIMRLYRDWETDRKSTRLNSSHSGESRMPSSA